MNKIFLIMIVQLALVQFESTAQNKTDSIIRSNNSGKIYYDNNKRSEQARRLIAKKDEGVFIELNRYHNEYVLYAPCDWITHKEFSIRKDVVLLELGESDTYKIISKKEEQKNGKVTYDLTNKNKHKAELSIVLYDKSKSVYAVRYRTNGQNTYFFAIPATQVELFRIIVNDCQKGKAEELKFDEINLKRLFE